MIESTPLPADEQDRLFRLMNDPAADPGERSQARDTLILSNVRIAAWVAKRARLDGVDHEDRYGWAYLALVEVVDSFKPELGWKFSTYARKTIPLLLRTKRSDNEQMIRVPRWVARSRPSPDDSPDRARFVRAAVAARSVTVTSDKWFLDRPSVEPPDSDGDREEAEAILGALSDDDAALLRSYYGIGRPRATQKEIGRGYGASRTGAEARIRLALVRARSVARQRRAREAVA